MDQNRTAQETEMTYEERTRFAEFFGLLLKVDQRLDPDWYLSDKQKKHD